MEFPRMRELTSLTESDRKIALDRCRILQPHLQDGRALSVVAREAGVAYSTAQRSVRLYRRFGLSALARKERSDRGQRAALGLSTGQLRTVQLRGDPRSRARPPCDADQPRQSREVSHRALAACAGLVAALSVRPL